MRTHRRRVEERSSISTAGKRTRAWLRDEGYVWCWGGNDKGQLGDGTTTDRWTPVQVKGAGGSGVLSGVVALGCGRQVQLYGNRERSRVVLGRQQRTVSSATTRRRSVRLPVQVKGPGGSGTLSGIVDVAAGESFTCGAKSDGSVWCWGRNDKGQLGDNTTSASLVPVQVEGPRWLGNADRRRVDHGGAQARVRA